MKLQEVYDWNKMKNMKKTITLLGKDFSSPKPVVRELNQWVAIGISAGYQKRINEDAVGAALLGDRVFLAVADGHWGGEASAFAVTEALELLKKTGIPHGNEPIGWFFVIFEFINQTLLSMALQRNRLVAPETSLIVAHIQIKTGKVHWASFGDSFIYLCSKKCKKLNKERRTYLGAISVLAGKTAVKQIKILYPKGKRRKFDLYQSVGGGLEVNQCDLNPGDELILSTDGLPKCQIDRETIFMNPKKGKPMTKGYSAKIRCKELITSALKKDGGDNIACAIYQQM
jgi:serine/threonine protein phosphatase PrpC